MEVVFNETLYVPLGKRKLTKLLIFRFWMLVIRLSFVVLNYLTEQSIITVVTFSSILEISKLKT